MGPDTVSDEATTVATGVVPTTTLRVIQPARCEQEQQQQQRWKVEPRFSSGGGGCEESTGIESVTLRASLDLTAGAATGCAGNDRGGGGIIIDGGGGAAAANGAVIRDGRDVDSCDVQGIYVDRSGVKVKPDVRVPPSLKSRGSVSFAGAGHEEGVVGESGNAGGGGALRAPGTTVAASVDESHVSAGCTTYRYLLG